MLSAVRKHKFSSPAVVNGLTFTSKGLYLLHFDWVVPTSLLSGSTTVITIERVSEVRWLTCKYGEVK